MLNRKNKLLIFKLISLFSVVRAQNILLVIIAQIFASVFILSNSNSVLNVVLDFNLLGIVISTAIVIASGYIINNFYDSEKDLINRPLKSKLDRLVNQNTKLVIYFLLNFLSVFIASAISFRLVVFICGYIFSIWFYSHKLRKYLFLGNIFYSILAVLPFFAVFAYYKNFQIVIFFHAAFLSINLLAKDLLNDLENLKGDFIHSYQTIPVVYGERTTKKIFIVFSLIASLLSVLIIFLFNLSYMEAYFYFSLVCYFILIGIMLKSHSRKHYFLISVALRLLIFIGVFSIPLLDFDLFYSRILDFIF